MKKTSPYRICLICWLGALSIAIAIGLGYYFDFLVDYENVYQSSRPFYKMDEIMLSFEQMDMDTIYNWISQKPEINAFETEENVKNYMRRLLADATFSYAETDNSFEERPEYYIFANDYIIAKLSLKKRTNEYLPYGFPIWDISDFEFYTQADYECSVLTPNNGTIYLNGIPVSDDYCYQRVIVIDERSYVEDYATLPAYRKRGLAGQVLERVIADAKAQGRKGCVLTCKDKLIHYYEKFGFQNEGVSASTHGGVVWYDMRLTF